MSLQTSITFTNRNPNTIWNQLAKRLGREPTSVEAGDEVRRILRGDSFSRAASSTLSR